MLCGYYLNLLIDEFLGLRCKVCHKKIRFSDNFIYKNKQYYCSKECYEFI